MPYLLHATQTPFFLERLCIFSWAFWWGLAEGLTPTTIYFQHTLVIWEDSDNLTREELKYNHLYEEPGEHVAASFAYII